MNNQVQKENAKNLIYLFDHVTISQLLSLDKKKKNLFFNLVFSLSILKFLPFLGLISSVIGIMNNKLASSSVLLVSCLNWWFIYFYSIAKATKYIYEKKNRVNKPIFSYFLSYTYQLEMIDKLKNYKFLSYLG